MNAFIGNTEEADENSAEMDLAVAVLPSDGAKRDKGVEAAVAGEYDGVATVVAPEKRLGVDVVVVVPGDTAVVGWRREAFVSRSTDEEEASSGSWSSSSGMRSVMAVGARSGCLLEREVWKASMGQPG